MKTWLIFYYNIRDFVITINAVQYLLCWSNAVYCYIVMVGIKFILIYITTKKPDAQRSK